MRQSFGIHSWPSSTDSWRPLRHAQQGTNKVKIGCAYSARRGGARDDSNRRSVTNTATTPPEKVKIYTLTPKTNPNILEGPSNMRQSFGIHSWPSSTDPWDTYAQQGTNSLTKPTLSSARIGLQQGEWPKILDVRELHATVKSVWMHILINFQKKQF